MAVSLTERLAKTVSSGRPDGGGATVAAARLAHDDRLIRLLHVGRVAGAPQARIPLLRVDQKSKDPVPPKSKLPELVWEAPGAINTAVTALPAALALSLTYLRSGNTRIAATLAPPATLRGLDAVRPDVLAVRVMGRALVNWHEHDADDADRVWDHAAWADAQHAGSPAARAGPQEARARWECRRRNRVASWLRVQVPAPVRRVMVRLLERSMSSSSMGGGTLALITGKTANITDSTGVRIDVRDGPLDLIDLAEVRTAYAMSLAGAALGLGLRYAGTGDSIIRDELLAHLSLYCAMREAAAPSQGEAVPYMRVVREIGAAACAAHAAVMTAARALYLELRAERGLSSAATVHAVNALIFPRHVATPAADDLISVQHRPPPSFPFSVSVSRPGYETIDGGDGDNLVPASDVPSGSTSLAIPIAAALALSPSRYYVEAAIVALANAVALVMAGTGDVTTLRALRSAQRRADGIVYFGSAMGLSAALGYVTLGGGRATLSRSDAAIAALVAAVLPVHWPISSSGQAFWPQAPRALWALAVDARVAEAVDVRTGSAQTVDLRVDLRPTVPGGRGRHLLLRTPCLLPELHTIEAVAVLPTNGFEPYTLHVGSRADHAAQLVGCDAIRGCNAGTTVPASVVTATDTSHAFLSPLWTQARGRIKRRRARSTDDTDDTVLPLQTGTLNAAVADATSRESLAMLTARAAFAAKHAGRRAHAVVLCVQRSLASSGNSSGTESGHDLDVLAHLVSRI